ncbi:MAG TPA: hypothetical protein VFZ34_27425 [Blastocatellia bacterium]|nr:hypothetical protein [Blastocatellia bacterium]
METTTITRYLLGQLPDAERDVCEQEWFTDKAKYDQFCEAENALIDDYVRGDLCADERALFEQHFMTIPARRERVLTARALVQTIDRPAVQTKSRWQRWRAGLRVPPLVPVTAMAVLLLVGWMWMYRQQRVLQTQLAQAERTAADQQRRTQELERSLADERAANARLTEELDSRNKFPTPLPVPSLTTPKTLLLLLQAGVMRSDNGASLPTLKLGNDVERVQLQVNLPAHDYKQLTATLRTAEGREVQHWRMRDTAREQLNLFLEAQPLKAGDYVLVVRGINAQGEAEEFRRLPFLVRR